MSHGPSGPRGAEVNEQGAPYPGVPSQEATVDRQRPSTPRQLAIFVNAKAALGSGRVPRDCQGCLRARCGAVLERCSPRCGFGRNRPRCGAPHQRVALDSGRACGRACRARPPWGACLGAKPPKSASRCVGTGSRGTAPNRRLGTRPPSHEDCPTQRASSSGSQQRAVVESGSPGEHRAADVGNGACLQRTPQRINALRFHGHVP